MSTSVFYERAVALDRQRHQKLKIDIQPGHFSFASKINALPIAATEFADAARNYPIVFVGGEPGSFHVAALLGLRNQENLFVNSDGAWDADTYIPAFARRYPFVLAASDAQDRFAVCVDEAYAGINEQRGTPLFADDGKESDYLQRMLGFLRAYHAEVTRTRDFANRLAELGMLESKVIAVEKAGQKEFLRGLWIVDEAKLKRLDDARIVEFFHSGYLRLIELQRWSLANVTRLAKRLEQHISVTGLEAQAEAEGEVESEQRRETRGKTGRSKGKKSS